MKKLGPVFLLLAQTCVLCAVTIFCVAPVSCRITEEGIVMLTGDYEAPKLSDFTVIDEHTLSLAFNESVRLENSVVSPQIEGVSYSMEHSETKNASPAIEAAVGNSEELILRYSVQKMVKILRCFWLKTARLENLMSFLEMFLTKWEIP